VGGNQIAVEDEGVRLLQRRRLLWRLLEGEQARFDDVVEELPLDGDLASDVVLHLRLQLQLPLQQLARQGL